LKDDLRVKASKTIVERLTWCTATRDQAGIAKELADGDDISEIYGLGEATVFDEFFYFLDQMKISNLFPQLDPDRTKRSSNVNFHSTLLIYVMRLVAGISFFWQIEPVLLCSLSLMRLVGFNGRQIREGTTARGLRKPAADTSDEEQKNGQVVEPSPPDQIRGPYCPESIAASISSITVSALECFFSAVIKILAANRFFPKRVHALLDATEIESTEQCNGCGKVKKERKPDLRARKGRLRKIWETVFGFKAWVVWDPNSKLPLALRFTTIEVPDITMARAVVEQAIANLGDHAKIASLACDKAFLDGAFLWWLNLQGIIFYIPAKTDMHVYQDALSLVDAGEGVTNIQEQARTVGHGKNRSTVTDRWEVVGLAELTSAGFYGELGSGSHENRKDFVPNPINAVVAIDDPYKKNNPDAKTMVILTNDTVTEPIKAYNGYDARSEIENSLFREAKQAWFIERPAQKTMESFRAHVYLTLIVMALVTAYRAWMEKQDRLQSQATPTGIRKFREMIRQENANLVIIFHEDRYALFKAYELAILLGRRVLKPRGVPENITKEDILRKHGVLRE